MAEIINMPRLSDTMEEGTVSSWLKKVGDQINEGDILAEIETDKATMEFESFHSGELLYIGVEAGKTVPVDSMLAIIGEKNEDISSYLDKKVSKQKNNITNSESEKLEQKSQTENKDISTERKAQNNFEIIKMPRLSDTMEEGTVSTWLKKVGDEVKEGDIIAEIETDKATMEFESFHKGTLLHIGVEEGKSAPVDEVLAIIGDKSTDVEKAIKSIGQKDIIEEKETKLEKQKEENISLQNSESVIVDNTKYISKNELVKSQANRIFASPLAKKMASEKGIMLNNLVGTGDGGRIIKRDIENFMPSTNSTKKLEKESSIQIQNSQIRKTIAKRLSDSKFSAPHYYLNVEYNVDNLISFREQYNSQPETKISFNDLIIKATALSLSMHPVVNSQWSQNEITHHKHVHVGVAVAVEDGLVVPVLKFADNLNLNEIGLKVKDFANRAQEKKLLQDEIEGSTFTISNLGMFGIESFTSIINQPNSAILSVGSIIQKPVVKKNKIVVSNTMKLTLACDHRTIDGASGSKFLQTLKDFIENPIKVLL
ncbi:MAG: pyruvate dehydrogenase [Flavobacteriales bacterium]|nr:MAG: pyruvate dehydrogenase [Flavobacteriales bacterium TMED96]RZP12174.1 MAG: pyruvate dehydrogenase [Flavobacteriales bacterium]|tara:strand:- start:1138 stop:2760 length:1623 start_codon:yes stop_codon:yes gene_type:complete